MRRAWLRDISGGGAAAMLSIWRLMVAHGGQSSCIYSGYPSAACSSMQLLVCVCVWQTTCKLSSAARVCATSIRITSISHGFFLEAVAHLNWICALCSSFTSSCALFSQKFNLHVIKHSALAINLLSSCHFFWA